MTAKELVDAALAKVPPESTTPAWVNTPNNRAAWEAHAAAVLKKNPTPDVDRYAAFMVCIKIGA